MKISMVIDPNRDPRSKTRPAAETAPATAPPPAKSVENVRDVSLEADAGSVLALHFDAPASGTQTEASPIEDATAAERGIQWARQSILDHPAHAMLAQANSNPESALRLLV